MNIKKHNCNKLLYKKFVSLRKNIQNRSKLYNFKRKKWQKLIFYLKKKQSNNKNFYAHYDNKVNFISKFGTTFKKRHKSNLQIKQKFNLFYGRLKKTYIKNIILNSGTSSFIYKQNKAQLLQYTLESRLDTVLYRSHFVLSIRSARQLISHGHVFINNEKIYNNSFIVKIGDIVTINERVHGLIKQNLGKSNLWPLPPKYLCINFKILKISVVQKIIGSNLAAYYPFWLDWNTVIQYYKR